KGDHVMMGELPLIAPVEPPSILLARSGNVGFHERACALGVSLLPGIRSKLHVGGVEQPRFPQALGLLLRSRFPRPALLLSRARLVLLRLGLRLHRRLLTSIVAVALALHPLQRILQLSQRLPLLVHRHLETARELIRPIPLPDGHLLALLDSRRCLCRS